MCVHYQYCRRRTIVQHTTMSLCKMCLFAFANMRIVRHRRVKPWSLLAVHLQS